MIIGTAGHIDHGKTALVRALTGIDTDRLPQEKQRGITIELGFAYQTLKNGERIGFVDVPGHEKLVHTMLTGAGSIDYVMLVVAADDGIMPQTREHFEILKLMGIKHGVVVITRIDLVDKERVEALKAELHEFLKGSFLENAPIFPVSSLTGEGIEALREEIENAASHLKKRVSYGRFRHAIDRCFVLSGAGTVVTGTVVSGEASTNDLMVIAPDHLQARLRSIHVQDEVSNKARTGDRAALNIVGDAINKDTVKRGMMVIDPFLDKPSQRFDVRLTILPSEPKPLKQWFPVHLHHGSLETNARLVFLSQDTMKAGETAYVQIISDKAVIAATGDRFVIRDTSASRTIGGGIILDPLAPERHRRAPERFKFLAAMEKEDNLQALSAILALPPYGIDWLYFCRARNLSEVEAGKLLSSGHFVVLEHGQERFVMEQQQEQRLQKAIVDYLVEFHKNEPDLFGVGLEKLRRDVAREIRAPYFRDLLQNEIDKGRLKIRGAWVGLAGHEAKLSPEDEAIWQRVYKVLKGEERFRPPRTRDFAQELGIDENHMRQILKSCARMGRVYEVAQDYFFPREVLAEIIMIMRDIAEKKEKHEFVAADLRDRLNNGRKVSIFLLEFFDRHGVTIRKGDIRRLNPHRLDLFADS
ncbi:selenocysteine-specific elongation factor [Bartonella apis]|uniref:selenocysteine-specific translation elongation factor n=1 Tax=Bartonella apis TaxID=1686310 RepID=UPI000964757F|nr:selenocysteine-specific translation elongation factor [Bartonella apis]OLY46879.1 selenocysteine-specific elongation factor [Bartonella apis]